MWFIFGLGALFSSIILSMQTQILRWGEKTNIIPIGLYKESEKSIELSTNILQQKVQKAQKILYIGYALFLIGLTSFALSVSNNINVGNINRFVFIIPLLVTIIALIYINKKDSRTHPY